MLNSKFPNIVLSGVKTTRVPFFSLTFSFLSLPTSSPRSYRAQELSPSLKDST